MAWGNFELGDGCVVAVFSFPVTFSISFFKKVTRETQVTRRIFGAKIRRDIARDNFSKSNP